MAKVLVFTGWGSEVHTEKMNEIMNNYFFPRCRINEVCEYIEESAIFYDYSILGNWEQFVEILKSNPENIYYFQIDKEKTYYIYDKNMRHHCKFEIVDVDTSRPWRIAEYDGSEYIQYLDYNVIDEEFNYCQLKDSDN